MATGALSPGEIASPLRGVLKRHRNPTVVMGDVTGFDLFPQTAHVETVAVLSRRAAPMPGTQGESS